MDLRWLGLGAALSVLALSDSARATSISYSITGVVIHVWDPEAALDASVEVGAPFTGFVSYEPPGVAQRGGIAFPVPPAVISVEVGSLRVGSGPPSTGDLVISVLDGTYFGPYRGPGEPEEPGGDSIGFDIALPASNGPPVQFLSFDLVDPTGQALSDASAPTGPLDPDLLTGRLRLGTSVGGGPDIFVLGAVDSLLLVPEPGTFLLCAAGLVLLVLLHPAAASAATLRPPARRSATSASGGQARARRSAPPRR
jgi:hypothetical protein